MLAWAQATRARGDRRRRPARPRGRPRAPERGLKSTVVHRSVALMNVQLDTSRRQILRGRGRGMGITRAAGPRRRAVLGDERVERPAVRRRLRAGVRHGRASRRHPPERGARRAGRDGGRARHRRRRRDARASTRTDVCAVGECCAAPWGGLRARRAAMGAGDRARRSHHGRDPHAAYHGSKLATKLKVSGVELATMGLVGARAPRRRGRPVLRAAARRLQDA